MSGYSFPAADNSPRFVDAPLGPVDRLRSWLGWHAEGSDPLLGPPMNTLRMDDGQLQYGDGDDPIIVAQLPGTQEQMTDGSGQLMTDGSGNVMVD